MTWQATGINGAETSINLDHVVTVRLVHEVAGPEVHVPLAGSGAEHWTSIEVTAADIEHARRSVQAMLGLAT